MAFSMKSCSTSKSPIITFFNIKTVLFHSTPLLERRRPSNWGFGGGYNASVKKRYNYSRRSRKMHSKHTLLRNVNEFAEHLFQSWRFYDYEDFDDPSSSKGSSWFRGQNWGKRKKRNKYDSQKPQWGNHKSRGGFNFCFEDDEDVEVIFRSAFGAERGTYWSFIHDDSSQWSSSYTNNRKSWKWRSRYEDEYESYKDYNDDLESDVASDRLALGLSASGPLKLEDVKNAYHTCALKWHPDRHQGSSKAEAEEKFKLCSAAYQSLCDKLE